MTTFEDREKAFESQFKHDEDLRFRVEVRRNKLLGRWIATELLGRSSAEADVYAKEVISADFEEPGEDDVIQKIMGDLATANVDFSEHRLRRKLEEYMEEAKRQIMQE